MDERPFPHGPLPQPPPSRRGFLVVGGLAAVSAGAGVWWALSGDDATPAAPPPGAMHQLRRAASAEAALIAGIDAAAKHGRGGHHALALVRADHVAHLGAIRALIAELAYPAHPSLSPGPVPSRPGAPTLAEVRLAEQRAAATAAKRAAGLSGQPAVLLASIAAAEASHVEVLK